ncbi:cuticle protein-like [Plodia interpunctella]|uniref:cuticle protein-like n=1 Tax=Plodia interpunctella TaxID=58824 RepID=UPI002368C484|nr:cuticle protein-like [Plodia interpunctella]
MAAKLAIVFALATVAHSSVLPLDHADVRVVEPVARSDDVTSFSYDVADPYTGDFKSQSETRVGGAVQGQYSLLDADGTRRTVDYAADDLNGFNAVVRKDAVGLAAPVLAERTVVKPALARTVAAPLVSAVPNVLNTGIVSSRAVLPPVYAASAPLVSQTVLNAPLVTRNYAAPVLTGANLLDGRTIVGSNLLSSRTLARPVLTGAPLVTSGALTAPSVYNAPLLTRTVATPSVVTAPLVTRTLTPQVYAASAPLVTGGYTIGQDLQATRTLSAPLLTGTTVLGGQALLPGSALVGRQTLLPNTLSSRLVTGGEVVRSLSGW